MVFVLNHNWFSYRKLHRLCKQSEFNARGRQKEGSSKIPHNPGRYYDCSHCFVIRRNFMFQEKMLVTIFFHVISCAKAVL
jgi:hypothetical protein